jgi:hypothetical protein
MPNAYITANNAGDYPTALRRLENARALLVSQPNLTIRGRGMTWNPAAIDKAIVDVRRKMSAAGGIVRQSIAWKGPFT